MYRKGIPDKTLFSFDDDDNDIILYNSDKQRNIRSFKAIVKFYKGSFIAEKIGSKKKNYCSFLLLSEKRSVSIK